MSVRLHRKLLKSGYPWELRMRENEGEFLLFTLHTSISSEFFTVSMSSNITSVVKSGVGEALSLPFCLRNGLHTGFGLYWEYMKPFQGVYGHQELQENQFPDLNFHMHPYVNLMILTFFQSAFAELQFCHFISPTF